MAETGEALTEEGLTGGAASTAKPPGTANDPTGHGAVTLEWFAKGTNAELELERTQGDPLPALYAQHTDTANTRGGTLHKLLLVALVAAVGCSVALLLC